MLSRPLWNGVDRRAFLENAILLDLKCQTQGDPIKSADAVIQSTWPSAHAELYPYAVTDLLDDLALIISGSGGKDRVTGVCLEIQEAVARKMILRIARNGGITEDILAETQTLLNAACEAFKMGISEERVESELLARIVIRSNARLLKHIDGLWVLFRSWNSCDLDGLSVPAFVGGDVHVETQRNAPEHGDYSEHTHVSDARASVTRLRQMIELTRSVAARSSIAVDNLQTLATLAMQADKSSLFCKIVFENAQRRTTRVSYKLFVAEFKNRLGQIAKFARAARTVMVHIRRMVRLNVSLTVLPTPSLSIQVPELSKCTPAALRRRGGRRFSKVSDNQCQSLINRWPKYREHAEVQLIMFYEEHPSTTLHSEYIGCDKLACYLCYNFILQHGRFQVGGCHQAIYSLWTVRDEVCCSKQADADRIRAAIVHLSNMLDQKVKIQRQSSHNKTRFAKAAESVANTSRPSLILSAVDLISTDDYNNIQTIEETRSSQQQAVADGLDSIPETQQTLSRSSSSSFTTGPPREAPSRAKAHTDLPSASIPSPKSAEVGTHMECTNAIYNHSESRPSIQKHKRRRRRRTEQHKGTRDTLRRPIKITSSRHDRAKRQQRLGLDGRSQTSNRRRQRPQKSGPSTALRFIRKIVHITLTLFCGRA